MTKEKASELLQNTKHDYLLEKNNLPKQESIGATITLNLACYSIVFFQRLGKEGFEKSQAIDILYTICWDIYSKMGEIPLMLANIITDNDYDKMKFATQLFRKIPFSSPDYIWQDVESDQKTVAFDCQQCRVAEYFIEKGLGDVCYQTWCKLDFPLAEKWGGKLERQGSIANGDKRCDFRWKTIPLKNIK